MERFAEITEPAIAALVARFYAKARLDPLIGPVFNDAVEDWDEHLRTLNAFWSSVMLTSGRYKGNPMAAHLKLPIEPPFFERWLALWRETAAELFAPDLAAAIRGKGRTHRREPQARAVLPARRGRVACPCRGDDRAPHPAGLPAGLVAYRRTPIFDQDTIPAGLRREHRTASGVWGLITVLEGRLRFRSLHPVGEDGADPGHADGGGAAAASRGRARRSGAVLCRILPRRRPGLTGSESGLKRAVAPALVARSVIRLP